MGESRHTPGPWVLDLDNEVELPCIVVCELEYRCRPISVMAPNATDYSLDEPADRVLSDGNLIAAAPDMLEALRDLAERVRHDIAPTQTDRDLLANPVLGPAYRAIRKAEGGMDE